MLIIQCLDMVKCSVYVRVILFAVFLTVQCRAEKEQCESSCIEASKCQFFKKLKQADQPQWRDRFQCEDSSDKAVYGFSSSAKGDLVCCPENVWQIDNSESDQKSEQKQGTNPNTNSPTIEKNSYYDPSNRMGSQYGNRNSNQYGGQGYGYDDETTMYENTRIWQNRNRQRPIARAPNSYYSPTHSRYIGSINVNRQCQPTILPPDPSTGCCGIEADKPANQYPNNDPGSRKKRDTDEVEVEVGNRIAGGQSTDLEQFPWTTLLKTTYALPEKDSVFTCGGSLISSKFILTAGHCVYDHRGSVKSVDVYLSEYDKTTFPKDCKTVVGKGQQCIENIVMQVEKIFLHPEYDDSYLHNDIALLTLSGQAPFTDYIRPICLPPLNVDHPDLSYLRLAVAGWGRNGQYRSDIKQSTVVNLITNEKCEASYPGLTKKQLCAAGFAGQDACKGDSGGPLMMMHGGKYYLSGIVSGKKADAPCGTSVPSLYTNVYQYMPWILDIIRKNSN